MRGPKTKPDPVPCLTTVKVTSPSNPAVTDLATLSTLTLQGAVPGQPGSDQPKNTDPEDGVAVNVTIVPILYEAEQVVPQSIPAGLDVTVPVPVPNPTLETAKSNTLDLVKVAVTVSSASTVTLQAPVPKQPAPDHPEKTDPAAGVAIRVTDVVK